MTFYVLDPSYYTLAEITAIDKAIAAKMPAFAIKATDIESKYLPCHIVNLMDNLELL